MSADMVAREAQRQGRVLGVRFPMVEEEVAPWARPPSGRAPRTTPQEAAPASVHCVRGNRFYVDRVGLPAALVTDLGRLAAFQNPDFYMASGVVGAAVMLGRGGVTEIVDCAGAVRRSSAIRDCSAVRSASSSARRASSRARSPGTEGGRVTRSEG
jgi:hypothetical protein